MEKIEQVKQVIDKFIDLKAYKNREEVLGIIFYGSYVKGGYSRWSDIDLHIITKAPDCYRGRLVLDGYIIEYLERNIDSIKAEIEIDKAVNRLAYLSMLARGIIIYQKDNLMQEFQNYIVNAYENFEYSPAEQKDLDNEKLSFFIDFERAYSMYKDKNAYFNCYYYIYLNNVRLFYQKLKQTRRDVSNSKVYKFYTNKDYDNIEHSKMPDNTFINLYLKCVKAKTRYRKMKTLTNLFEYVKSQFEFNFEDVYIKIKSFKKD